MAITRLEVAVMAPKTQAVTEMKQPELQRPKAEQVQISNQIDKTVQQNTEKPVKTTKSEYTEYRYDAKNKGNNSYNGKGKKKDSKDNKQSKQKFINNGRPGSIDIKI